jgi:hypothetical protein
MYRFYSSDFFRQIVLVENHSRATATAFERAGLGLINSKLNGESADVWIVTVR